MTRTLILFACFLGFPGVLAARPAHKQALAGHMGDFLPARLNDCRLCHVPGDTDPHADKPRNRFGERLEEVRNERRKAGKPIDLVARVEAIADEDTDGDGISNLREILTAHFPADPQDKPTPEELRTVEKTQAKYRRFLASYPWRPFEKPSRPPVPPIAGEWGANPIDAFIAAGHREQELTARPQADKATLLRRVTFDLIGLPPTADELTAFLHDEAPDAYERVVDRLLASPHYGERWGRHWMDVWRYSDWAGWSGGNQVRDSQPHIWRWRDWIVENLNADTGYDRMIHEMLAGDEIAPTDPNVLRATGYLARCFKSSRQVWLTEAVDHTFLAFQGLTIGCARCHDHFYDPIPQREYYQVRAVFEPYKVRLDPINGVTDTKKDGLARVFDADLKVPTYLLERGDDRTPDKSNPLAPGIPTFLNVPFPEVKSIAGPQPSTGRRTAFAHWLTDPRNPLTARVAVNHIWLRHFGAALVPSVFDFGKNGRRPVHPALLDWLACELIEKRWSMKHLHRLIVRSRTYRLASTPDAANLALDRDNRWYWRMTPRRLEAEAVRDQLLFVAGLLDPTFGGPDLDHEQGLKIYRRSLYFRHAHEKQMELLKLFDVAGTSECYQRRESIVPQQALALVNSALSIEAARRAADRIASAIGSVSADRFADVAFQRILGRSPTAAELSECVAFLSAEPKGDRRGRLVQALFNHHEFVTIR